MSAPGWRSSRRKGQVDDTKEKRPSHPIGQPERGSSAHSTELAAAGQECICMAAQKHPYPSVGLPISHRFMAQLRQAERPGA